VTEKIRKSEKTEQIYLMFGSDYLITPTPNSKIVFYNLPPYS